MKGFFGYAVCLAMIITLLYFTIAQNESTRLLTKTKNELIIAENANMQRTLLENNADRIIYYSLISQALKKNFNNENAKKEINFALSKYLIGKTNSMTIFFEVIGKTTHEYLNENSKVLILGGKEATYAEYTFTSNLTKTNTVGKIFGNKIKIPFIIPAGSTTKIII